MIAPVFLETNPSVFVPEMIAAVEASLGKTLYPAQLERILVDVIAYRESLERLEIQAAATQGLVDFATGAYLEALGSQVGVSRLPAAKASTTLRITLPEVQAGDSAFPAGWQAVSGGYVFELTAPAVIPAGSLSVDAQAEADVPGAASNGIEPTATWSPMEGDALVESLTTSEGGLDEEGDESLRVRILEAPGRFSAAGSVAAYRYHSLSASSEIIDVAVDSPSPGVVGVYPLVASGLPGQAILDLVTAALDAERVRPICDLVQVESPVRVPWSLDATLTLLSGADAALVLASAQSALEAYAADRRAGLGRSIMASKLHAILHVEGVHSVALNGWADLQLNPKGWADATTLTLHIAPGRVDG
jgi:phage-related baseplate assembly protein